MSWVLLQVYSCAAESSSGDDISSRYSFVDSRKHRFALSRPLTHCRGFARHVKLSIHLSIKLTQQCHWKKSFALRTTRT